jgi:Protein tyrosine/serine phosphatase
MKRLQSWGVKSIINLRTNPLHDQQAWAQEMGIKIHRVKTGVMIEPGEKEIEQFIRLVADPANQPAYICCTGGRDRTVFYVALYRMAMEGWTAEQAKGELRAHKLRRIWPIFWRYDDILREREAQIHQLAGSLGYPKKPVAYNGPCPCTELGIVPSAIASKTQIYDGKHDRKRHTHLHKNDKAKADSDLQSRLPDDQTLRRLADKAVIIRDPQGNVAANLIYVR